MSSPASTASTETHVNNCDRGIDVDGAANTIIRNTSTNCTIDYTIVADNRYGPIIGDTAIGTAAVNGGARRRRWARPIRTPTILSDPRGRRRRK